MATSSDFHPGWILSWQSPRLHQVLWVFWNENKANNFVTCNFASIILDQKFLLPFVTLPTCALCKDRDKYEEEVAGSSFVWLWNACSRALLFSPGRRETGKGADGMQQSTSAAGTETLSEQNYYLYCWTVFFCETTGNDLPHKCLAVGWVSSQQTQEESSHARLS